ncbi:mannose-1-phosphate guanylyltransferase [Qipengyuania sp.]|uniref:mannose-1-phosphate guanylyltransferase n=1 Tax=Qipengyuania sp. TaxID=2004515 RepID=UPI0037357D98
MTTGAEAIADQHIHPVILCGGSGTRLWPRSRPEMPKPFLRLLGDRTLFQMALDRAADPSMFAPPIVVAGEGHAPHVREQAGTHRLIIEPAARNTAPAIALAAARLPADAVMLVCPSDHHIGDVAAFREGVGRAAALARQGYLVAFGIEPDRAETGYGYIQQGDPLGGGFRIARFVEKPDAARAESFLAHGGFVWNSGIFVFRAGDVLAELEEHRPAMAQAVRSAVAAGHEDGATFRPDAALFTAIEAESVDYAVMEHTARAAMVSADMGWSDIGDWAALAQARAAWDRRSWYNARGDVIGGTNVMIDSDGPRVSVVGLSDVVVIVDKGEVLVVHRDAAQQVGALPGAKGK